MTGLRWRRRLVQSRGIFTALTMLCAGLGVLLAAAGWLFEAVWVRLPGASEVQTPLCRAYWSTLPLFSPAIMLQLLFQTFFVTAG